MNRTDGADLCGIAVNWYLDDDVAELIRSWPRGPRYELIVVDNSSSLTLDAPGIRILQPGHNLGFAGAVNLGCQFTEASIVVILNPDVRPAGSAIEALLDGFETWPDAVGLAPRLIGPEGSRQTSWQLRSVPSGWTLLAQSLLLPVGGGPSREPGAGAKIEQPAAAALALRRDALVEMGGFDVEFYPAWFEDVDLAARLRDRDAIIRYCPQSEFTHRLGASVSRLGYGEFLSVYYKNLGTYLRKHHGATWALASRCLLLVAVPLRLILLPLRRPRRAESRRDAARGLLALMRDAATAWRADRRPPTIEPAGTGGAPGADV